MLVRCIQIVWCKVLAFLNFFYIVMLLEYVYTYLFIFVKSVFLKMYLVFCSQVIITKKKKNL